MDGEDDTMMEYLKYGTPAGERDSRNSSSPTQALLMGTVSLRLTAAVCLDGYQAAVPLD